jgi:hypothetical protein
MTPSPRTRGEGGVRGPRRLAEHHGDTQTRGDAPSPSLRLTSPRVRGEVKRNPFSRCICIRGLLHATHESHSIAFLQKMEGGEAPKGANQPRCRGARPARTRSPLGAPPRLSPVTRRSAGSAPGHASWDADPAGVTRLHLSQSRDCTSRTGRSAGVFDARSRPGAVRNAARGDRPRSTSESTLAKGPSVNEVK